MIHNRTVDNQMIITTTHFLLLTGKKIPWGVGKLLKSGNSTSHTTSAVYSMTPAQSSVAAENAALIIAVSSANKIYSGLFMLMACVIFSIVLFTH